MDFNVKTLHVIDILGVEVWITETIVNTWRIMAFLIILAIISRIKLRKSEEIPKGLQNVVEMIVEAFDNFVKGSAGEKLMCLGNWYFMVFTFILVSNISGVVGLRPPTADWATTFAFALATFALIQIMGFKFRKGEYAKSFLTPHFVFLPLNLIGELARPVSLSFRLFGNILSGMILMSLLYTLAPIYVKVIIPAALHGYFDVFIGVIQTYIFSVLSLTFIGTAAEPDDA